MNPSRGKILFWCMIVTEAAGSQVIMWNGLPVDRRLLSPGTEGGGSRDFALAAIVVLVMQIAHWAAFRLRPQLRIRRNVLLGYVLVFNGELSLFFVSALAVVILFDRGAELDFVLWKVILLMAILFATCAYKYQLTQLGDSMISGQPEVAAKEDSSANR